MEVIWQRITYLQLCLDPVLSPEFSTGRVSWNRSIFKLIMIMIWNQQRFLFAVDTNMQQTAEYEGHPKTQHTANIEGHPKGPRIAKWWSSSRGRLIAKHVLRNEEMYSYFYHPLYIVVSCVLDLIIICKHLLVFVLPHVVEESANNGYGNVIEFPEVWLQYLCSFWSPGAVWDTLFFKYCLDLLSGPRDLFRFENSFLFRRVTLSGMQYVNVYVVWVVCRIWKRCLWCVCTLTLNSYDRFLLLWPVEIWVCNCAWFE